MKRDNYIDRIRILLTCLIIVHHCAIAYGASGSWVYMSSNMLGNFGREAMSMFTAINQSFSMSLFFFLSAYFTPLSYVKKGFKPYIKDRLVRLGIPLIVFVAILNPLSTMMLYGCRITSFGEYVRFMGFGHMWFVAALLVFELLFVACMQFRQVNIDSKGKLPSRYDMIAFIIITALGMFIVRQLCNVEQNVLLFHLCYFPLYIAMYAMGIIARCRNWLEWLNLKGSKGWITVAFVYCAALFTLLSLNTGNDINSYFGGFDIKTLLCATWESTMCVGVCYWALMYAKEKFNGSNNLVTTMSRDSYMAYFIHPFVVVAVTWLLNMIEAPALPKMIINMAAAVAITFCLAHLMRKIKLIGRNF